MKERWTPAYDRVFDPDHELAGDTVCRRFAWLDLCRMASYRDGNRMISGTLVPLKRGEFVASLRYLGERWGWSRGKVSRFLTLLSHPDVTKIGTVRETPVGTVYAVVNYDTYAVDGSANGTASGTAMRPTAGQGRDRGVTGAGQSITGITGVSGIESSTSAREEIEAEKPDAPEADPTLDQSPAGVSDLVERWPVAGEILAAMKHPGGRQSTVSTLNARFLYHDLAQALLPDASVKGRSYEARLELVGAALVEMRDQGKAGDWSAPLLSRFIQRVERTDRNPAPGSEASRWTASREREHYNGPTRTSTGGFHRPLLPTCDDCGNPLVRGRCPTCEAAALVDPTPKELTA